MEGRQDSNLQSAIESLIAKVKRFHQRPLGEQNTKASLIEPLLEALGWDVRDPDEVHREYKGKRADKPVDYAIHVKGKPRLFIEAKGLGENLADRKWVSQVLWYATVAGVTWCIVTDGDEYRLYNARAPVDADDKLFCRVRLSEGPTELLARTLSLLSRANLEQNSLDQFWEAHFVDRRVSAALSELFVTANPALVRLVRRAAPELTGKEISDSILRHQIKIDPSSLWGAANRSAAAPQNENHLPKSNRKKAKRGDGRSKKGTARTNFGIELKQLIEVGLLEDKLRLFRRYKGQALEATLHKDGSVEFQGERYPTCSRAAEQARSVVTGRRMNTNGWSFWQYTDAGGKTQELIYARQQYIAKRQSQ